MYPTRKSPERAIALQEYLVAHSRRESLQKALNTDMLPTPAIHPHTQSFDSHVSLYPVGPSQQKKNPLLEAINNNAPQDKFEKENELNILNSEIKRILMNLLNCETVKADKRYRMWVQSRLMDTERRLSDFRRRRCSKVV